MSTNSTYTTTIIDEPQTLTGLFPPDSDDDEDEEDAEVGVADRDGNNNNSCCYEIQSVVLAGATLNVRQYDYHSHNANRVWPGTFNLADYLLARRTSSSMDTNSYTCSGTFVHQWGRILELGSATGLLSMRLAMAAAFTTRHSCGDSSCASGCCSSCCCCCTTIVTSDVQDEYGDVESNLRFNYERNRDVIFGPETTTHPPLHVPHTWGTGWKASVAAAAASAKDCEDDEQRERFIMACAEFETIIASDILLYVSAYPALVETLKELMIGQGKNTQLVMSWNRRMKESAEFFDRMQQSGFLCTHQGKCIYTFVHHNSRSDDD